MLNNILTKLGIYSRRQTLLSFEFGAMFMDVCHEQKITVTKEIMQKVEEMLVNEFSAMSEKQFAQNMGILILAMLQEAIPSLQDKKENTND